MQGEEKLYFIKKNKQTTKKVCIFAMLSYRVAILYRLCFRSDVPKVAALNYVKKN